MASWLFFKVGRRCWLSVADFAGAFSRGHPATEALANEVDVTTGFRIGAPCEAGAPPAGFRAAARTSRVWSPLLVIGLLAPHQTFDIERSPSNKVRQQQWQLALYTTFGLPQWLLRSDLDDAHLPWLGYFVEAGAEWLRVRQDLLVFLERRLLIGTDNCCAADHCSICKFSCNTRRSRQVN